MFTYPFSKLCINMYYEVVVIRSAWISSIRVLWVQLRVSRFVNWAQMSVDYNIVAWQESRPKTSWKFRSANSLMPVPSTASCIVILERDRISIIYYYYIYAIRSANRNFLTLTNSDGCYAFDDRSSLYTHDVFLKCVHCIKLGDITRFSHSMKYYITCTNVWLSGQRQVRRNNKYTYDRSSIHKLKNYDC